MDDSNTESREAPTMDRFALASDSPDLYTDSPEDVDEDLAAATLSDVESQASEYLDDPRKYDSRVQPLLRGGPAFL